MALDDAIAELLVDLCRGLQPCFRVSIRASFFALVTFMFVTVVYVSMNFTRTHVPYSSLGSIQPVTRYIADQSECLSDTEYAEQIAKEANGTGLSPPPKDQGSHTEGPRLPWKHWNWCYPHPINVNFTIAEKGFCLNKTVPVLRLVISSPFTESTRSKVRTTATELVASGIHTLFLMGNGKSEDEQTLILQESEKYHDIVQVDMLESNYNSSLKMLAGFHWVVTHCSHAKFIYRAGEQETDPHQAKMLKTIQTKQSKPPSGGEIYCAIRSAPVALALRKENRPPGSKDHWLINYTDYPEEYFPQYCIAAYAMPMSMAKRLLTMWTWSRYFQLEGVYITGILPIMMGNATRIVMG